MFDVILLQRSKISRDREQKKMPNLPHIKIFFYVTLLRVYKLSFLTTLHTAIPYKHRGKRISKNILFNVPYTKYVIIS